MRSLSYLITMLTIFCSVYASAQEMIGFTPEQESIVRETLANVLSDYELARKELEKFKEPGILEVDSENYLAAIQGKTFVSVWKSNITTQFIYEKDCKDAFAHVIHSETTKTDWIGQVYICPAFFSAKSDAILQTQILSHELTHVEHGSNECLAMLHSYWIKTLAGQKYIYEKWYWETNKCEPYNDLLPPSENILRNND